MRDLVSVVVPTFNRAHCLSRAVDSALDQTYPDLEVIVVDDGSTDNTPDLMGDRYGGAGPVRYVYQPNRGVAAARNTGLQASRGQFIAFLDSDDIWHPWKLELQVECMRRLPEVGMLWTDMEALAPDGSIVARRYLSTMYANYRRFPVHTLFKNRYDLPPICSWEPADPAAAQLYAGDIFSPMVAGNLVHTSTVLLRRERLDRVGKFDPAFRVGEDYDFHLRTCREGPVGFIDLPTIGYQTGMSDQIVRQSHSMARAFLTTLTETLARDGERIDLSRETITEVLAEANAWIAESLVAAGEPAQAAPYFKQSLRYRPWQPRAAVQLALCHLPPAVAEAVRWAYRNSRRPAEAGVAGAQS